MDIVCSIFWEKTTGNVYAGSITTVRPAEKGGTWDGTEYTRGPVGNKNHILIFVTGVPITNILSVQYALERWASGADPLEWHVKEAVATAEERAKILTDRYITVTWARFKELVQDAADVVFSDADLRTEYE